MPRYDTVVVGAGPAGAATALHLARSGARVLLCDRSEFPRDKACGGGLTPRGVGALDDLGVKLDDTQALRVGGIEMGFGIDRNINSAFPQTSAWPDYGLVGRRSVMDNAILEAATGAGAELRTVRCPALCSRREVHRRTDQVQRILGRDRNRLDHSRRWSYVDHGSRSGMSDDVGSGRGFWYAAMRSYFGPIEPIMRTAKRSSSSIRCVP